MTPYPVLYAVLHEPGPAWQPDVSFQDQPLGPLHVGYMAELCKRGVLVMGGPFLDDSGGLAILRADSLEAADAMAHDDPSVTQGLLRTRTRPWMVPMSTLVIEPPPS